MNEPRPLESPPRGAYRHSRWGQVHYLTSGSTGPFIALIHECPLSSRVWWRAMSHLAPRARVAAFDIPGCGSSSRPPSAGHALVEYASVLAAAIEAEARGPVVVAGVHSGASLAIEIAHRLRRVSHVVISGPLILDPATRDEYLSSWAPPKAADSEGDQIVDAVAHYRRIWPGLDAEMLELAVTEMLRNRAHYHWAYNAAFAHDPAPTLAALDVPVLALTAEHDRLARSDAAAMGLAKDARQVVAPDLPGQPHLRRPRWYADQLLSFVGA